jgi:peptidylprolyl isomerase
VTTTAKRQRQREGRVARMEAERRAAIKAARRRRIILGAVVLALIVGLMALFAVLGGDDEGDREAAPSTTTTTAPDKPEVTIPETPPPTTLQSTDLTVGDGEEAQIGDAVKVHYIGKVYATGDEFDSSYERDPIEFTIGQADIIPGWNQGVVGMRAGGRRQLIIPPDLGYGADEKPDIPANSTLVIVIDLIQVEKAPAPPGG